jgi:hypothetical protein
MKKIIKDAKDTVFAVGKIKDKALLRFASNKYLPSAKKKMTQESLRHTIRFI